MTTGVGLRPPHNRVDPRCKKWWGMQVGLCVVVPQLALMLASQVFSVPVLYVSVGVGALVCAAALVGIPKIRWAIHRWEVTDTAIYSRSGLLWEEWRAAPLSRVQTVDKTRGPLQRQFDLATVVVTTASSKGAVRISALDADLAEEMVDRLTLLAEDDQRDAT